ncbi:hypothetical protein [Flavobacterium sp. FlaQc-48]|uniref:hypothetical protein n=1 Tax=Flavobacterium sp. FlaQc-48 TaxID=3374181 RepID=UPI003757C928
MLSIFFDKLADERPDEQVLQSIILENLILLYNQGMILLDEMTDRSTITPKGLKAAALTEDNCNNVAVISFNPKK